MEIKLSVRQISREKFEKYSLSQPAVYFRNGCWFDAFDNVCAFPLHITLENPKSPFAYYEVYQDCERLPSRPQVGFGETSPIYKELEKKWKKS